jgi:FtsH-binding integral membrane protein
MFIFKQRKMYLKIRLLFSLSLSLSLVLAVLLALSPPVLGIEARTSLMLILSIFVFVSV